MIELTRHYGFAYMVTTRGLLIELGGKAFISISNRNDILWSCPMSLKVFKKYHG